MSFTRGLDPKLLTPEEAADRLSVSPHTLRHWVSAKRIEFVRLGRVVRFRSDQLDRFVDRRVEKEVKR